MNTQQLTPGWRLGSLCKRGHDYEKTGKSLRNTTGHCCDCANLSSRRHYQKPDKKKKHFEKCRKWMNKDRRRNPIKHLVYNIRARSTAKKLPFDLTLEYLERLLEAQEHRCYWLGIQIEIDETRSSPTKATVERLQPEAGYVIGNVVWASSFANRGRVDTDLVEFTKFVSDLLASSPRRLTEDELIKLRME